MDKGLTNGTWEYAGTRTWVRCMGRDAGVEADEGERKKRIKKSPDGGRGNMSTVVQENGE